MFWHWWLQASETEKGFWQRVVVKKHYLTAKQQPMVQVRDAVDACGSPSPASSTVQYRPGPCMMESIRCCAACMAAQYSCSGARSSACSLACVDGCWPVLQVFKELGPITCISASPNGAFLAVGTAPGVLLVFDMRNNPVAPWFQAGPQPTAHMWCMLHVACFAGSTKRANVLGGLRTWWWWCKHPGLAHGSGASTTAGTAFTCKHTRVRICGALTQVLNDGSQYKRPWFGRRAPRPQALLAMTWSGDSCQLATMDANHIINVWWMRPQQGALRGAQRAGLLLSRCGDMQPRSHAAPSGLSAMRLSAMRHAPSLSAVCWPAGTPW